jgi:hypothetical protein
LKPLFRDVASEGFSFQSEFNTIALRGKINKSYSPDTYKSNIYETDLIFIQFAVSIFLLSLVLKCDNNETDEDIDHEKGNNNNVNKIEAGNHWPVVVHRSHVFRVRVNRDV